MFRYLVFLMFCLASCAYSSDKSLYFISIGNEHYACEKEDDYLCPDRVVGAKISALKMAQFFISVGAKDGLLILSKEDKFITVDDVYSSLRNIVEKMTLENNAMLILYYCGHGYKDIILEKSYLVMGNAYGPKSLIKKYGGFGERAFDVNQLVEILEAKGIEFSLFIDACRSQGEGDKSTIQDLFVENMMDKMDSELIKKMYIHGIKDNTMLTEEMKMALIKKVESNENPELINQLINVFNDPRFKKQIKAAFRNQSKKLKGDHCGSNPVAFAAENGFETEMVNSPELGQTDITVGPICRQVLLIKKELAENITKLSYNEFIEFLESKKSDYMPNSINICLAGELSNAKIFKRTVVGNEVEKIYGSLDKSEAKPLDEENILDFDLERPKKKDLR